MAYRIVCSESFRRIGKNSAAVKCTLDEGRRVVMFYEQVLADQEMAPKTKVAWFTSLLLAY